MYQGIIIAKEDEVLSTLSAIVRCIPEIQISMICQNSRSIREFIASAQTLDLVIWDIDQLGPKWHQLASDIRATTRKMIICSVSKRSCYRAFDVGADAYFLKPLQWNKALRKLNDLFPPAHGPVVSESYCLVKCVSDQKLKKIRYEDIFSFESAGNYLNIHLMSESITIYMTLKEAIEQLSGRSFFIQVSRSRLVSKKHIESIKGRSIEMSNGTRVSIGGRFQELITEMVTQLSL